MCERIRNGKDTPSRRQRSNDSNNNTIGYSWSWQVFIRKHAYETLHQRKHMKRHFFLPNADAYNSQTYSHRHTFLPKKRTRNCLPPECGVWNEICVFGFFSRFGDNGYTSGNFQLFSLTCAHPECMPTNRTVLIFSILFFLLCHIPFRFYGRFHKSTDPRIHASHPREWIAFGCGLRKRVATHRKRKKDRQATRRATSWLRISCKWCNFQANRQTAIRSM